MNNDKEYVEEKLNEIIPALSFDQDDFVYNGGKKEEDQKIKRRQKNIIKPNQKVKLTKNEN